MATLETSRGYPYPASSETPDVPRDLQALADRCNDDYASVANYAALPANGDPGRRRRTADTGNVYLDIGSAWVLDSSANAASLDDAIVFALALG